MNARGYIGVMFTLASCTAATSQEGMTFQANSGPPIVPGQLNHMVLSGTLSDSGGAPVPGGLISFVYLTSTAPGTYLSQDLVTADGSGNYTATFDAVPDAIDGGLSFRLRYGRAARTNITTSISRSKPRRPPSTFKSDRSR